MSLDQTRTRELVAILVLIHGQPDQGKSTLARALGRDYGYTVVSVDAEYVRFIREKWPSLDHHSLECIIETHHDKHIAGNAAILSQWLAHMEGRIEDSISKSMRVVVEGYALKHVLKPLQSRYCTVATVKLIEARDKKYFDDGHEVLANCIAGS